MRRLSLAEVLRIHREILATSGGSSGTRDLGRLQSALSQPWATFDGAELYPNLVEKAAVLGFSIDEQEAVVLGVAAGSVDRVEFTAWLRTRAVG